MKRLAKWAFAALLAAGLPAGCAVYEPGGYPYRHYGGNPYGPNFYDPPYYYGPQIGLGFEFGFHGSGRGHRWDHDGRGRDRRPRGNR